MYPDSDLVAHLVGFVGEATEQEVQYTRAGELRLRGLVGKDGLEREYDGDLRGADGVRFVEVSAMGRLVREAGAAPPLAPVPGRDVATTLDLNLQRYVARSFPAARRGAVVVMTPGTGEILALYSSPSFNPNAFVGGIDPVYWAALNRSEAHPLINRAIHARYPPASTWKLVVAAMAMKRGIANLRTRMPEPCRGGLQYGNRYFRCWALQGHGSLDLEGAIAHSCDVYFYQLGLKLGLTSFLEDAAAWGFRQKTGVDLPGEITADFPAGREYFDRRYGPNRWTPAVMLNLAIGQGENSQTLMKMVQFYAMLAGEGRAPVPHLARGGTGSQPSLDVPPDELAAIRQSLIAVVEEGTGRGGRLRNITIAGKTGTAQNPFGPDHGWFIGFAPAAKPEVVVGA
ncbi:MAG: penicillin-binding transpeptidase domain-containing protein, partial [Gemmatimonadales bacterium]